MKYAYLAIFTPAEEGGYCVEFPDIPPCCTCADNFPEALEMAMDALSLWLWDAETRGYEIPPASQSLTADPPSIATYIFADTDDYHRRFANKAVKKTLSIPSWLNYRAEEAGVNFSQLLQQAIKDKLGIEE